MSTLIVEVCLVEEVRPHPNADRLRLARVKGWWTCIRHDPDTGKSEFEPGDKCIYFPPDAVLPPELYNGPDGSPPGRLNNGKYLADMPLDTQGKSQPGRRVKAARLRGYPSFGVIMPIDPAWGDDLNWEVGDDVAEHFGVTKWQPPCQCEEPDSLPNHPRFSAYTEIESFGNFPTAIREGTPCLFSEKIHGNNARVGMVLVNHDGGEAEWELMVGSAETRRCEYYYARACARHADRESGERLGPGEVCPDCHTRKRSKYWEALTDEVKLLLVYLRDELPWAEVKYSVQVFVELYGDMDMKYGLASGKHGFRGFDMCVNGRYLDKKLQKELFARFGIEPAPVLEEAPFSVELLERLTSGPTTMCPVELAGAFKGREGIVVTPLVETFSDVLNGRMIIKSVSADFKDRKKQLDGR